jgi:hypothetical protein
MVKIMRHGKTGELHAFGPRCEADKCTVHQDTSAPPAPPMAVDQIAPPAPATEFEKLSRRLASLHALQHVFTGMVEDMIRDGEERLRRMNEVQ